MKDDTGVLDALPILDDEPNRRQMLSGLCGVVIFSQLSGCAVNTDPDGPEGGAVSFDVDLLAFSALANPGGLATVDVGSRKVVLIRRSETEIIALDRLCSHLGCDMGPDNFGIWENDALRCTCHNTRFGADGTALPNGATDAPIEAFAVTFDPDLGTGTVFVGVDPPSMGVDAS